MRLSVTFLTLLCSIPLLFAQPEISLETFSTGLIQPTNIENMGDGRLFVTEQRGVIKVISAEGVVSSTPFLDIRSNVNSAANERGLLGLAFHPNYEENGYFFVNYSNSSGDTRISRFSVMPGDSSQADPNSEVILLEIDQPYSNHNGGCIKFGPDGYLYIGMGDGGSGGDPQGNGQNTQVLLAKLLRIDVNNGSPYGIPEDNPFVGDDSVRDEIWAIGVRNPWRFSFDRQTGDLWIADVGQNQWEEIDFQEAGSAGGENYGWNCYEGFEHYDINSCSGGPFTSPIHTYDHNFSSGGCSVTGGYVYRGLENPGLVGRYFFTDFCTGLIWTLSPDNDGGWNFELIHEGGSNDYSTFGENSDGELFVAGLISGKIYKIVEECTSLSIEGTVIDESCDGAADGQINLELQGTPPLNISWSNGATTDTLTGLIAGQYSVTITDASNCQKFSSFDLQNNTSEAPDLQVGEDFVSVDDIFSSYQWYLNGDILADSTNAILYFTQSGNYMVEVTNEFGCPVFSNSVDVIVEQSYYPEGDISVNIIPNPTTDDIRITVTNEELNIASIQIIDIRGRLIQRFDEEINKRLKAAISVKGLTSGLYFVVFNTNKGSFTKKLLKQ